MLLTKCSVSKEKPQPSVPVVVDEKIMSDDHKECTSEIVNGVKVTFNVDDVVGDGEPGEKMEEVEDVKDVDVPGTCIHYVVLASAILNGLQFMFCLFQ